MEPWSWEAEQAAKEMATLKQSIIQGNCRFTELFEQQQAEACTPPAAQQRLTAQGARTARRRIADQTYEYDKLTQATTQLRQVERYP